MATRLTKDIRDSILTEVLRHRFQDRIEVLIADRAYFAEKVYNDIYRKADREKMEALPNGWLPNNTSIGVQFGDGGHRYTTVLFDGAVYGEVGRVRAKTDKPRERVKRRVPYKHSHGCVKVYEPAHKLSVEHQKLEGRFDELKQDYETAKRQASAALASVSTINRLVEVWPEIEPFARKYDETPPKLPAVPTSELNKLLDLPVAA